MTDLRVIVAAELIMDGAVEFPRIGDHVRYDLLAREARTGTHPQMRNDLTARAEPLHAGRLSEDWTGPDGITYSGTFSMLLHGAGWGACLSSGTLHDGVVQLTAVLEAEFPGMLPEETRTAGTVTACHLITETSRPAGHPGQQRERTESLGPVPDGQSGFASGLVPRTPMPADPRGWSSELIPPPAGPWIRETGVLVELRLATPPEVGRVR